jgi:hypothetical protein
MGSNVTIMSLVELPDGLFSGAEPEQARTSSNLSLIDYEGEHTHGS